MTSAASPEPLLVQNVTAVSGFAYGVIAADIHVLPGGAPLYLLANWQPAPAGSPGRLREMLSGRSREVFGVSRASVYRHLSAAGDAG